MRVTNRCLVAAVATLIVACGDPAATTNPVASHHPAVLSAARNGGPDTIGTPDFIVDARRLESSWEVGDEVFEEGSCASVEGGIPPGPHRTVRFTVATSNIGTADVYVGDPNQHFDPNGDGDPSDGDGLFEFASCHEHYHFRNYATYELFPVLEDGSLGEPIESAKQGFCMRDTKPAGGGAGGARGKAFYTSCGAPARGGVPAIPGNQGISTGWTDIYDKSIPGQVFIIDDLPPGEYIIRVVANPPFVAQTGEPCPHTDSLGFCHMFLELDYANNVAEARMTIPVTPR